MKHMLRTPDCWDGLGRTLGAPRLYQQRLPRHPRIHGTPYYS